MFGPVFGPIVFMAAVIAVACASLGGVYIFYRHVPPQEEKTPKRPLMSNLK